MHRMMSPLPLFAGNKAPSMRVTANGQSIALSSKEKRYQSNVERALQAFDSVDEWADYISFLGKLQKALHSNPDVASNNWIPMDFQVATTMAKCVSPKLPSGVHRKTIEVYSTIFDILGTSLASYIHLWLPGLFPLMSYASISVKPELIALYQNHLAKLPATELRTCIKPLLLSLLPAVDDTTSEFFATVIELIDYFKKQLQDDVQFWQCMFLCIITSPDKRAGAMEYLNKRLPTFTYKEYSEADNHQNEGDTKSNIEISLDKMNKESIINKFPVETRACITPEPGLLIKSFCEALRDDNLYVQRGFFDLLLTRLPLSSPVFQYLVKDADKETLILSTAFTILRKDMSLNRRLWSWLLGLANTAGESFYNEFSEKDNRLEYFKTYGLEKFSAALMNLISGKYSKRSHINQIIEGCRISIAIMDKWEIGMLVIPIVLVPIIKGIYDLKQKNELSQNEYDLAIKVSNELFDGIETNIIWQNIFKLIKNKDLDLAIFILNNYNVEDEDMIIIHTPLILLGSLALFDNDLKLMELIQQLAKMIPSRALLPLDLSNQKYLRNEYFKNNAELKAFIVTQLDSFYNSDHLLSPTLTDKKPFPASDMSALYLGFVNYIMCTSLKPMNGVLFLNSCQLMNTLLEIIPASDTHTWNNKETFDMIVAMDTSPDIDFATGLSLLFKHLIINSDQFEKAKLFKITLNNLWECLISSSGDYQVEIVYKIWDLELLMGSQFVEAGLCRLLLSSNSETRSGAFNILWMHSNNDKDSNSILIKPLYLILDDLNDEVYFVLVERWIRSTINSGTLNKLFKIVCMELYNNNFSGYDVSSHESNISDYDFKKVSYEMNTIINLLNINVENIMDSFKSELCIINNDLLIDTIKLLNWDVSTYKSFLILILLNFLKMKITPQLTAMDGHYIDYLNCVKVALNLLETLLDGTELNYDEIVNELAGITEKNYIESVKNCHLITSYYLSILTKLIKISSKRQLKVTLFELPKTKNSEINMSNFITRGILNSNTAIEINCWFNFILSTSDYYSELVFLFTHRLTSCVCEKIDEVFGRCVKDFEKSSVGHADDDECIGELILGLEKVLNNSHKYLGYISSSSNIGFGSLIGNPTSKEAGGFFGSVIQGVFQVEAADENAELNRRKLILLDSFSKTIATIYRVWIWTDEITKKDDKKISKSQKYRAQKLKFRCKKIIENSYLMEPLQTVDTLIKCCGIQNKRIDNGGLKIIQILDESGKKIILPHILNSLVSRVHFTSLEGDKRSSLNVELNRLDISRFLVIYSEQLSKDRIEEVWDEISNFLKNTFTNSINYKQVYPDILKFVGIVGSKLIHTSFGELKKVRKELSESFTKALNFTLTLKVGQTQEDTLINDVNSDINTDVSSAKGSFTEKAVFREEVCGALKYVIPNMGIIVGDNDKLQSCFSNIINALNNSIFKSSSMSLNKITNYMIDLLVVIGDDPFCCNLKIWKGLCYEIINDSDFFKVDIRDGNNRWNLLMKNWIIEDENKMIDMINNKITLVGPSGNSGALLFNWNDEVEILNSNIPVIKRVIYLILINEKDEFIKVLPELIETMGKFFKAIKHITKTCEMELYLFMLIRVLVIKFSENHLVDIWPLVFKEVYIALDELVSKLSNYREDNEGRDGIDLGGLLQICKLIDVLFTIEPEDFQLNEWVFVNNTTDGIYGTSKSINYTLIEKVNDLMRRNLKSKSNFNGIQISRNDDDTVKKPMLIGVKKIEDISSLRDFFIGVKVHKYENEYELKTVDYESIQLDLFHDIFTF